jgi:hypothetical protein
MARAKTFLLAWRWNGFPFKAMSRHPYPDSEHYPASDGHQDFLRTYNKRLVE